MAMFKEVTCSACGAKAGLLTRSKLKDGTYVCSQCKKKVPGYIKRSLKKYTLEDFQNMKQYLIFSKTNLKATFQETHCYKTVSLDAKHGLFCLEELGQNLYLQLHNLADFNLTFEPEKAKEGTWSDNVIGKVQLSFEMHEPYFKREVLIATGVKAPAVKKGIINKKMVYDMPKGMEDFLLAFHEAWKKALEEENRRLNMELVRLQMQG